jgi:hypothetical protein
MDPGGSVARPDRRHSRDHAIKFFGGDRPTDAAKRISECDQGRFDMCAQRALRLALYLAVSRHWLEDSHASR